MARRFVDLSVALEVGIASDPPGMEPQITYRQHADTVGDMARSFPGLTAADMPDGEGWAVETVTISTHNGTTWTPPGTSIRPPTTAPAAPPRSTRRPWNSACAPA